MRLLNSCLLTLALALPAFSQLPTYTYTYSYSGAPIPILPDNADVISVAKVVVPKALKITKVVVKVDVTYPAPGDLNVFFYSPIGTRARLAERNCGTNATLVDTTFDDDAQSKYADFCPTEPGRTFRGNEPLSNFNDQNSLGVWWLGVENNGSNDRFGYLRGVTVTVTGTVLADKPSFSSSSIYNLASRQLGPLAPGETFAIVGQALGADPGTRVNSGDWPSSLAGTQVLMNNVAIPVGFSSNSYAVGQVPFQAPIGSEVTMVVANNGVRSDEVKMQVVAASPAFMTVTEDGTGGVKAINQDGTQNSQRNPAPKGSVVAMYAVGLGRVSPELPAGYVPPLGTLSRVVNPVAAYIDGLVAPVSFAGLAPGTVGFYQVNLQIPADAGSGARPIFMWVAGYPTQSGVTIYVK